MIVCGMYVEQCAALLSHYNIIKCSPIYVDLMACIQNIVSVGCRIRRILLKRMFQSYQTSLAKPFLLYFKETRICPLLSLIFVVFACPKISDQFCHPFGVNSLVFGNQEFSFTNRLDNLGSLYMCKILAYFKIYKSFVIKKKGFCGHSEKSRLSEVTKNYRLFIAFTAPRLRILNFFLFKYFSQIKTC